MPHSLVGSLAAVGEEEDEPEPPLISRSIYYFVAFFALWFGPGMFDQDGDGDFDVDDVGVLVKHVFGLQPPHAARAAREARAARRTKAATLEDASLNEEASSQHVAHMTTDTFRSSRHKAQQIDWARRPEQTNGEQLYTPVRARSLPATRRLSALPEPGESAEVFDIDMSLVAERDEGADIVAEHEVAQRLRSGQVKPLFIALQCLLVFMLWIVEALRSGENLADANAGLETLLPGYTELRLYRDVGDSCDDLRDELWRLLTYQFTHIGFLHVTTNVLLTLALGIPLEALHGNARIAFMFNLGVLGGALCCFLGGTRAPVVGMSGGVYALMGIHFADLALNWSNKRFRKLTLAFLVGLAAIDILATQIGVSPENASQLAHVGGFIAGTCVGVCIGTNFEVKRHERILQGVAVVVGLVFTALCLAIGMRWPPQGLLEDMPWCWARQVWSPALLGAAGWHCVRCGSQACIDAWSQQQYVEAVSAYKCETEYGWKVSGP